MQMDLALHPKPWHFTGVNWFSISSSYLSCLLIFSCRRSTRRCWCNGIFSCKAWACKHGCSRSSGARRRTSWCRSPSSLSRSYCWSASSYDGCSSSGGLARSLMQRAKTCCRYQDTFNTTIVYAKRHKRIGFVATSQLQGHESAFHWVLDGFFGFFPPAQTCQ